MRFTTTIQNIMTKKQLNKEALAELCNINISLLDQIIDGTITPSISTIIKISRKLDIPIELLIDEEDNGTLDVTNKENRPKTIREQHDINISSLAPNKPMRSMDPFMLVLGGDNPICCKESSHEGEEFLYIVEGVIELTLGGNSTKMKSGDTIYYDAIVPHSLKATDGTAKILVVMYTPW